jgi:hypothetical protein
VWWVVGSACGGVSLPAAALCGGGGQGESLLFRVRG